MFPSIFSLFIFSFHSIFQSYHMSPSLLTVSISAHFFLLYIAKSFYATINGPNILKTTSRFYITYPIFKTIFEETTFALRKPVSVFFYNYITLISGPTKPHQLRFICNKPWSCIIFSRTKSSFPLLKRVTFLNPAIWLKAREINWQAAYIGMNRLNIGMSAIVTYSL